jgi:hypothetical protein
MTKEQCDGRYPVPGPRSEPSEANITYRCGLKMGHQGPHGPLGSGSAQDNPERTADEIVEDIDAGFARMSAGGVHWLHRNEWELIRPLIRAAAEPPADPPPPPAPPPPPPMRIMREGISVSDGMTNEQREEMNRALRR